MNRNGKALFAAAALMGSLLVGINAMVSEEAKQTNTVWALILFVVALAFWLWMRQDDRPSAIEAVEDTASKLDDIEKVQDRAASQAAAKPAPVAKPAPAAPAARAEPDDLTRVEGVGPKYRDALHAVGVTTYAQLAAMSEAELVELVKAAGMRKRASMATWAEQAALAASGDWDALEKLQNELSGGRR